MTPNNRELIMNVKNNREHCPPAVPMFRSPRQMTAAPMESHRAMLEVKRSILKKISTRLQKQYSLYS